MSLHDLLRSRTQTFPDGYRIRTAVINTLNYNVEYPNPLQMASTGIPFLHIGQESCGAVE